MDHSPVIVEQEFNVSLETLWTVITEPEQMRQWFFENIPDFKAVVGFKTQFTVQSEERKFLHLWEIIEVQPQQKIVYSWKYGGYAGDAAVTFALSGKNDRSQLTVSHVVLKEFPQEIPEFRRGNCLGGWQYFIQKRLPDFLSEHNSKKSPRQMT